MGDFLVREYILEMKNIYKEFPGVVALNKVNFKVKRGTIHALVGENGAGKSTLMKILAGLYTADKGEIFFKGEKVNIKDSRTALKLGISMIHQELNPVPNMTVAENIFLGREPETKFKGFVNFNELYRNTKSILKEEKVNFNPKTKLSNLSVSSIQILEIIRAITYDSSLIIMDEPTSALTESEVENLYKKVKKLKNEGVTIIFITHKLDEIFKIVDEVTILRDGKFIETNSIGKLNMRKIISMMVGRKLDTLFPRIEKSIGDPILEVKGLKTKGVFNNINFKVRKGEILGISGLMGSGRTELARAIFGLDPIDKGEIVIDGRVLKINTPRDAIREGIVMVTEDRKNFGVVLCRSILENISLPNIDQLSGKIFLNKKKEYKEVNNISKSFSIKAPNLYTALDSLSGGNQQKVVVAKWILSNPRILILDEPTRGIDVGAKYEIHKIIGELAKKGLAIIMISSELPEILGMSDRILVMHRGEIRGELLRKEANQEKIMAFATGGNIED